MDSFIVLVVLQFFTWGFAMEIPTPVNIEKCENDDRYIIGGRNTTITEFPYVVSIEKNGKFICGGMIISEVFVLTAAHCLQRSYEELSLSVRVGSSYIHHGGVVHKVKRTVPHPKYVYLDYDVGVLELEKPVKFNENASAIEISDKEPMEGDVATVSGYGIWKVWGGLPPILQTVDVPVIEEVDCRVLLPKVTPRMFCTYGEGKSPHRGDSGSPIIVYGKAAGAVSWGTRWPTSSPAVYSKLVNEEIREFIKRETGI